MKFKKLNMDGLAHYVVPALVVVVVAVGGVALLVGSHADSAPCYKATFGNGSSGHCVQDIQTAFNALYNNGWNVSALKQDGGRVLTVDGQYGANTTASVKAFQRVDGRLSVDGIVGPNTWSELCVYSWQYSSGKAAMKDAGVTACSYIL